MEPNNVENNEGDCDWKLSVLMTFDTKQEAYDFYNAYRGRLDFTIRLTRVRRGKSLQGNLFVLKRGFGLSTRKIR
ncbi:hypothetical protein ACSBR1_012983 [Camellia fascicularis]